MKDGRPIGMPERIPGRTRDQELLPGFDRRARERLERSRVLCARIGGLGGPAALELAAAGVGMLRIAHGGVLEPAHRNRMIAMADADLGRSAAVSGAEGLRRVNAALAIETFETDVVSDELAARLVRGMDLVLSAPPSSEERMRLNAAAHAAGVPLVDAAMHGWTGQVFVSVPGETACLACIHPDPPPLEKPFPVLGALSGLVGCLAAAEAVKLLAGLPRSHAGVLIRIDLDRPRMDTYRVPRRPDCPVCGS